MSDLTAEQIRAMPAGADMDELVSERVMGIALDDRKLVAIEEEQLVSIFGHAPRIELVTRFARCPAYSTDPRAMMEVIEKLSESMCCISIYHESVPGVNVWEVKLKGGLPAPWDHVIKVSVTADSMPLAVCRAALLTTVEDKNARERS